MNTIAIVQARLGSERLPGKVLEEIEGRPALWHVTARALSVMPTVVVCPFKDWEQIRYALSGGNCAIYHWMGPEEDVLGRFAAFVEEYEGHDGGRVNTIVRLTADCPFVDTWGIKAVADLVESGAADYATTNPGANRLLIDGYDAEAFTRELLMTAHDNAITAYDREHVTPWIQREAKNPWIVERQLPPLLPFALGAPTRPLRWTLDTPEDLAWFRAVAEEIDVTPPLHPTYEELMALLGRRPDLVRTG